MDLRKLYESAKAGAAENFAKHGNLLQVALAVTSDDELMVIGCPWANAEDRHGKLQMLRIIFATKRVKAYAVVSEAWTVTLDADEPFINARDSDRRKEIVVVSASDGETKLAGIGNINRPFDGPVTLGPINDLVDLVNVGGDLLTLLD